MSERIAELAAVGVEDLRAEFVAADGEWHGRPQWKCKLCPFSTVNELGVALDHVGRAHKEKFPEPVPAKVTRQSKLVDPYNGLALFVEV